MFNKYIRHDRLDYDFLLPPLKLDHYDWSKKEAEQYFHWFVKCVPIRAEYVMGKALEHAGLQIDDSMDPETILQFVWAWFLSVATTEKVPTKERIRNKLRFGQFGDSFCPKVRLSASTEFIIRDIGMLMGYLYTKNHSCLKWELLTKPKNHIFFNHPVLSGFVDADYSPPFHTKMEPIHMVGVQAVRLLDGRARDTDLRNIYSIWKRMIPEE